MRNCYDMPRSIAIAVILLAWGFISFVPSDPPIKVRDVEPRLREGRILLDLEIDNLFSRKVVGTIQSGLPAVMYIDLAVQEKGRRPLLRKKIFYSISYNIWEERYTVTHDTIAQKFASFDALIAHLSQPRDLFLAEAGWLKSDKKYVIRLTAGVTLISSLQTQKLNSWLQETSVTQSDIVEQERDWGFRFNLSKLVTMLIGGNHRRGNRSAIREIEFRVADLRK